MSPQGQWMVDPNSGGKKVPVSVQVGLIYVAERSPPACAVGKTIEILLILKKRKVHCPVKKAVGRITAALSKNGNNENLVNKWYTIDYLCYNT